MTEQLRGDPLPPLLLVPGAWHGAWCWGDVIRGIDPAVSATVALNLPFESVESDAAVLRTAIEELGPDTVVCGHSYGGRLLSLVADTTDVGHLVYLAAPTPNAAQLLEYLDAPRIRGGDIPDFETARATFYNECDEATARAAWTRLRPIAAATRTTLGLESRPWERLPSTYIVCLRDHALQPEVQSGMARNMRYSATIDSDHSPFITAPQGSSS